LFHPNVRSQAFASKLTAAAAECKAPASLEMIVTPRRDIPAVQGRNPVRLGSKNVGELQVSRG
jgi:hypothetical protein